jgi:TRAP transporter TAXI family solute receptor
LGWFSIENRYQTSLSLKSSGIKTAADIKGKRVGIGLQGSANFLDGKSWLWGYGIDIKDIKPFYMGQAEQASALKDGRIDVMLWTTGVPSAAIQELCISREINFIPTTKEAAAKISAEYPYYKLVELPAGSYKGMDKPYQTMLNNSLTTLKPALPEDMVYQMTKAIFSNLSKLGTIHNVFKELKLDNAVDTMPIPVHPGAFKYYKENKVPGLDKLIK